MIKLQYRPPEIRDQAHSTPLVPADAPLCSAHVEATENCGCGVPVDVRTIILRSVRKYEKPLD